MVQNRIIFFATSVQPNPEEIDYWVDLSDNPYGGSIKYFNGTEWVRLAASGGIPDLSNYYTKTQVNKLLNDKANISDVDSKVDDEEVKDVIKDIQFNTSNPNNITMVMFKYDGSNKTVSIPVASTSSAGIITSKDFLDFVKQHQLQELHTEMIDTFADIRAKYQKKLIAGLNIEIDQETNVISASGDLAVQWNNITNKPDFKPVATSGDYNDLINKLKPGKDVSISEDNTISIAIDSDSLEQSLTTLQSNIDKEAATARAAETKLGNDIATEKNRAESAEQTISTNLQNEINRATGVESTLSADVELISKTKVDKVSGKQLSTEDYTTEEKTKLSGIDDNANNYTLPAATTTTLGGIIVGDRLSIDSTGKLVATYTYTLPTASSSVLGGVKIGSNITNTNGTISITKANVTSALGVDPTTTPEDWYGVRWSETSSNPDCTRIGNMEMHRTLPIQSMMKGYKVTTKQGNLPYMLRKLEDDWSKTIGGYYGSTHDNNFNGADTNIMVLIPEFWWIDDYSTSSKTHNLKICPHAKPGWNHHKEAFVGAYEGILTNDSFYSRKGVVPSVNVTREKLRTAARNNGNANEYKWNIYTYNEHRAICHLFLVEYATRNSQKAVNTELTPEGFRQGGLGSGCTTGTATINGAQTWSFIPTGSSDSLGSGSGEVTVTIQQTDQSGSNTSTITRKCNRYRGIENPFGHIWKHTDDIISKYSIVNGKGYRSWSICENPINFSTNLTTKYTPICIEPVVTGYKTEIVITPTCDFFAHACTNGSETTYWCDYNWDNTDTSEHCLLIGGRSGHGSAAGLFALNSAYGVGASGAAIGSRLTYLPWAE